MASLDSTVWQVLNLEAEKKQHKDEIERIRQIRAGVLGSGSWLDFKVQRGDSRVTGGREESVLMNYLANDLD